MIKKIILSVLVLGGLTFGLTTTNYGGCVDPGTVVAGSFITTEQTNTQPHENKNYIQRGKPGGVLAILPCISCGF